MLSYKQWLQASPFQVLLLLPSGPTMTTLPVYELGSGASLHYSGVTTKPSFVQNYHRERQFHIQVATDSWLYAKRGGVLTQAPEPHEEV